MNRMIRLMSAVMLVGGLAACHDDPTVPLTNKEPDRIQASPQVMFVNQNATKELLLRLVDDANFSTPTGPYTVTNVAAGLTVVWDSMYRPDFVGSDSLTSKPIKSQHRYFVKSTTAQATSFTVSAGAISQVITVNVVPTTLGAALSNATPAIGDQVTITAPANLSFTIDGDNPSVVTIDGNAVVIIELLAKSITFIPLPGSAGPVNVTHVKADYMPTIADRTLETSTDISVPAITSVPLAFSTTSPAAGAAITVTAAGFRFESDVQFAFGANDATVLAVSADGATATIVPPLNLTAQVARVSNFHLASLTAVSLQDIPSVAAVTTPAAFAPGAGGGGTFGTAINLPNSVSTTMGAFLGEAGPLTFGADVNYLGGSNFGAPRFYKLVVTEAGNYDITLGWSGGGDFDLYVRDAADADVDSSPSGANPEHVNVDLVAGTYYIVLHNWQNDSPNPTSVTVSVR